MFLSGSKLGRNILIKIFLTFVGAGFKNFSFLRKNSPQAVDKSLKIKKGKIIFKEGDVIFLPSLKITACQIKPKRRKPH